MTNREKIRLYERLNAIASCFRRTPEVEDALHDAFMYICVSENPDADPEAVFQRALRRNRSQVLVVPVRNHDDE